MYTNRIRLPLEGEGRELFRALGEDCRGWGGGAVQILSASDRNPRSTAHIETCHGHSPSPCKKGMTPLCAHSSGWIVLLCAGGMSAPAGLYSMSAKNSGTLRTSTGRCVNWCQRERKSRALSPTDRPRWEGAGDSQGHALLLCDGLVQCTWEAVCPSDSEGEGEWGGTDRSALSFLLADETRPAISVHVVGTVRTERHPKGLYDAYGCGADFLRGEEVEVEGAVGLGIGGRTGAIHADVNEGCEVRFCKAVRVECTQRQRTLMWLCVSVGRAIAVSACVLSDGVLHPASSGTGLNSQSAHPPSRRIP